MSRLTRSLFGAAWLASAAPDAIRFNRALRDPARSQQRRLDAILPALRGSSQGRPLASVRTVADLQQATPIVTFDDIAPLVDRVAAGERDVLTTEPIEMLEPSGGSGSFRKWIPYTASLRREFASAVNAWMVDLHRANRSLLGTSSYWSISRAATEKQKTSGGVPIGLEDDTAYFGRLERMALRHLFAVPPVVANAPDVASWRRQTALALLAAADLGLVSVWSPSFLTGLLAWMAQHRDALADELPRERASRVRAAFSADSVDVPTLWPRLQLVSCWCDGFAATLLPALEAWLPGVAVQPKGVLATEGVVSIPLWGHPGSALAVTSHVIELRDLSNPDATPSLPHEARVGGRYQPILTTSGGLLRYALGDELEVVGRVDQTPLVRFVARIDAVSDLVGEKLSDGLVRRVLTEHFGTRFAMLGPSTEGVLHYVLLTDTPVDPAPVDASLRDQYMYGLARSLGQLAPLRNVVLEDGLWAWEQAAIRAGQRLGDLKPPALERRSDLVAALIAEGRDGRVDAIHEQD